MKLIQSLYRKKLKGCKWRRLKCLHNATFLMYDGWTALTQVAFLNLMCLYAPRNYDAAAVNLVIERESGLAFSMKIVGG